MTTLLTLYIDTDQVLRIPGITDRDGVAQEDATVAVTLLDRDGAVVMAEAEATFEETVEDGDEPGAVYELPISDELELRPHVGTKLRARIVTTLADGETTRTTWLSVYVTEDAN